MIRTLPKLNYSGLTVILSNPSRFDRVALLTATGGALFNEFCLQPDFNIMQCDLRVMEDKSPFLEGTKCILVMGETAMKQWIPETRENTLNEMRGSVFSIQGIPAIPSYFPQDAADVVNHERTHNVNSKEYSVGDESDDEDSQEADAKGLSATKRSNYGFWLRADTRKCKEIIKFGKDSFIHDGQRPVYKVYPSSEEVIQVLTKTKGQFLYFDIETDYEEQNLLCFAFSFDGHTIYSVPVLNHNYNWAYSSLHFVLRALAIAIRDNIIVAHNGASFDFRVLAQKYHIPIGKKSYDTMMAMHRCFPDVEKSLGHCTSYWTWERFHKDSDSRAYFTQEQMMTKLRYCGKDVFTMALIHKAITKYAKTIPGLEAGIQCAMDSIRPYLITSLQGIRYSQEKVNALKQENDRLMMQYLRIIKLLVGEQGMEACEKAVKGKAKAFPGSNTQVCEYFHELLGYPTVVPRSEKTGKPSLAKKAMFLLALKFENPVITFTLLYRGVQKEYGTLKFIPYKDDNNQVINAKTYNPELI